MENAFYEDLKNNKQEDDYPLAMICRRCNRSFFYEKTNEHLVTCTLCYAENVILRSDSI